MDLDDLFGDGGELRVEDLEPRELVPLGDPQREALLDPRAIRDVSPGTIAARTREIKNAFLSAKDPEEIFMAAGALPLRDWMDFAIRLMPKEVAVRGQFQIANLHAQLGPLESGK